MGIVLGIDEAGRGPVIGSMFVGGFCIPENSLEELESLGLKDSKKLSDSDREDLRKKLVEFGTTYLIEVKASDLDARMENQTINEVELEEFANLIDEVGPAKVFIDLPENDPESYTEKLSREIECQPEIMAEHEADSRYPVVSAASIVAKSARESHVKKLHQKYGVDFDSGYPHDNATIDFLKDYVSENGELPADARRQWSTSQRILGESEQTGLEGF